MKPRYSRHEGLFGASGQTTIAALSVAIVGLGGLGSHVAQQLAYLGVTRFVIVDFDVVTWSSLNRLIGAVPADAASAVKKVVVALRMIKAINPDAVVAGFDAALTDPAATRAVGAADVVFGCVDRDAHRLELTELCARHARTYIDLATDIHRHGTGAEWGGRVVVCDGTRCLICLPEILDQESIALDRLSPDQRAVRRRVYGVAQDALLGTGPSVVSLNGAVASLAVNEFLVLVTGLRTPAPQLVYEASESVVTRPSPTATTALGCGARLHNDGTARRAPDRTLPRPTASATGGGLRSVLLSAHRRCHDSSNAQASPGGATAFLPSVRRPAVPRA